MFSLLIVIIYVAFISLGLPDSLLGSAWPVMHLELDASFSDAGIITMIISGGTIVSSLFSSKITRKFGAGFVTAISVSVTAVALLGFSISNSVLLLCLWSIPYGLGAGAVDAALNNYVAIHYSSRHMNWLHCFWGVGAAISPYIMSYCLVGGYGWNNGYRIVSIIQIILSVVLFISLPLWGGKGTNTTEYNDIEEKELKAIQILRIKGVSLVLITFFAYCSLEQTAGLWASSYLVEHRGIDVDVAARFGSLFFLGITVGRFLCGFIADIVGDKILVRAGIVTLLVGICLIIIPVNWDLLSLSGLIIVGFGCAPIYPSFIHATPIYFGKENSQSIIGFQMASAYMGTTFMPPLFGFIAARYKMGLYPFYLIIFAIIMIVMSERLNKIIKKKTRNAQ